VARTYFTEHRLAARIIQGLRFYYEFRSPIIREQDFHIGLTTSKQEWFEICCFKSLILRNFAKSTVNRTRLYSNQRHSVCLLAKMRSHEIPIVPCFWSTQASSSLSDYENTTAVPNRIWPRGWLPNTANRDSVYPEVIRNLPALSVHDLKYFPLTFRISTQWTVSKIGGEKFTQRWCDVVVFRLRKSEDV
jgi:hypothetical protein